MAKRKRAAGGGAKPKGPFKGKSMTLTTRITPETREELERTAAEKGRSLSQEVEYRLRSFAGQSRKAPHIRSLADAVSLIASRIEQRTGRRFLDDPFTASAVRHLISGFLSRISPASTGTTPIPPDIEKYAAKMPSLGQAVKSPVALAELEAEALIYDIENAPLSNYEMLGLLFPASEGLSSIREHLGMGTGEKKR
jgi:hypothetical protein